MPLRFLQLKRGQKRKSASWTLWRGGWCWSFLLYAQINFKSNNNLKKKHTVDFEMLMHLIDMCNDDRYHIVCCNLKSELDVKLFDHNNPKLPTWHNRSIYMRKETFGWLNKLNIMTNIDQLNYFIWFRFNMVQFFIHLVLYIICIFIRFSLSSNDNRGIKFEIIKKYIWI